jgi:acetyl-CoA carboxylase alpha subunit
MQVAIGGTDPEEFEYEDDEMERIHGMEFEVQCLKLENRNDEAAELQEILDEAKKVRLNRQIDKMKQTGLNAGKTILTQLEKIQHARVNRRKSSLTDAAKVLEEYNQGAGEDSFVLASGGELR